MKSQDVITIFSFHFGHGENHLNMMFSAILNSFILIWAVLGFSNHKYIHIYQHTATRVIEVNTITKYGEQKEILCKEKIF